MKMLIDAIRSGEITIDEYHELKLIEKEIDEVFSFSPGKKIRETIDNYMDVRDKFLVEIYIAYKNKIMKINEMAEIEKIRSERLSYLVKLNHIDEYEYYRTFNNRSLKRGLGFCPINSYFIGSVCHHMLLGGDKSICIFIPETLHMEIKHDIKTGRGMRAMNNAALLYLCEQSEIVIV